MSKTVHELAQLVSGEVHGDPSLRIERVAALDNGAVEPGSLVWIGQPAQLPKAEQSGAACIVAPRAVTSSTATLLSVDYPKLAFAKILWAFHPRQRPPAGVHPLALLGTGVQLGRDVSIGPHVVIGDGVILGDRAVIGTGSYIGAACAIGADSVLYPRVTLYERTRIGRRVIIHAGSVIGGDGFGFVFDAAAKQQVKIPQVGDVIIEDDVELGSNVTVDRGTIGSTLIRQGVKIDNLVQIAHNVIIGEHTTISAQTGMAGSSRVEAYCILAGQVGVADHVVIETGAIVGAKAGIAQGKRIKAGEIVWGIPARPLSAVKRQAASLSRVPALLKEVAALRTALAQAGIVLPPQHTDADIAA